MGESREGESREPVSYSSEEPRYDKLTDIDKLIRKLEGKPSVKSDSPAVNAALEAKRKKLETLKKLVAQAKEAEEEEKLIAAIQKDSEELDRVIKGLKGRNR